MSCRHAATTCCWARPDVHDGRRLLVAVDQAEELFTRSTPAGRDKLAALLREAMAGPVRIVAPYGRSSSTICANSLPLPRWTSSPTCWPLAHDLLPLVVAEPARVAGLRLDPEVAARLRTPAAGRRCRLVGIAGVYLIRTARDTDQQGKGWGSTPAHQ